MSPALSASLVARRQGPDDRLFDAARKQFFAVSAIGTRLEAANFGQNRQIFRGHSQFDNRRLDRRAAIVNVRYGEHGQGAVNWRDRAGL